jgi:hypothetical protein
MLLMQLNDELRMEVQRARSLLQLRGRLIYFISITDKRDPFNEH